MKLAAFGVTRGVGKQLLAQALIKGHQVTAFARNPAVIDPHENLEVARGDVTDPGEVDPVVKGAEAVLFCVGPTSRKEPSRVCSDGVKNVIASMKRHGVRRLIFLSAWGAGDSKQLMPRLVNWILWKMVKHPMADKEVAEEYVKASGLEWVIVRPGGLADQQARGGVRAAVDASTRRPSMSIARADVAAWMLDQVQSDQWLGKTPVIGY